MPSDIKAYAFNLIDFGFSTHTGDSAEVLSGIELVGCSQFDRDDPDWACNEVFEAYPRSIDIPASVSGPTWELCLKNMMPLVAEYLERGSQGAHVLKAAKGVGIGFVDGDLELIG